MLKLNEESFARAVRVKCHKQILTVKSKLNLKEEILMIKNYVSIIYDTLLHASGG